MSSVAQENFAIWERGLPISLEAYHFLFKEGLISEKTELLEGVVIEKMSKDPIHSNFVTKLSYFLFGKLNNNFQIRQENPITTETSEPEPDIAIVENLDYSIKHPKGAYIVIEVANTSLALDRAKSPIYAKANIPEYIIINLQSNVIELYTKPINGQYSLTKILQRDETFVSISIPDLSFSIKDIIAF
ncbi:MAG: Uma2 family endonuclease [Leptospiraceae bacterium]|nr:Uma2 family endonuclease [Leptospiraceae bacterium]MCP5495317.1 Uma2 family endonuclease [Leptospiraceae bacterium]